MVEHDVRVAKTVTFVVNVAARQETALCDVAVWSTNRRTRTLENN